MLFNTEQAILIASDNIALSTIRSFWELVPMFLSVLIAEKFSPLLAVPFIFVHGYTMGREQEVQNHALRTNDYYIATGVFNTSINEASHGLHDYYDTYPVMQMYGNLGEWGGAAKLPAGRNPHQHDTVLIKVSYKHHFCKVINVNHTHTEIEKYMESVLFLDSIEQPRPDYDDVKLSRAERLRLMFSYHREIATVISKEKDNFLRYADENHQSDVCR